MNRRWLLEKQFLNVSARFGENGMIVSRSPKREVEIHQTIHCYLSDQALLRSFQVIPEFKTGVGNVDFMILGQLSNGDSVKVCVECKNAHSPDLIHGLTKQLPSYMENTLSGSGIY